MEIASTVVAIEIRVIKAANKRHKQLSCDRTSTVGGEGFSGLCVTSLRASEFVLNLVRSEQGRLNLGYAATFRFITARVFRAFALRRKRFSSSVKCVGCR